MFAAQEDKGSQKGRDVCLDTCGQEKQTVTNTTRVGEIYLLRMKRENITVYHTGWTFNR